MITEQEEKLADCLQGTLDRLEDLLEAAQEVAAGGDMRLLFPNSPTTSSLIRDGRLLLDSVLEENPKS